MTRTAEKSKMGRKKGQPKGSVEPAKVASDVMEDARIVVAVTQEGLSEYLSRLLRPLVARDRDNVLKKKLKGD